MKQRTNLKRQYGYIIDMIERYPFDSEIKDMIEELSYTNHFWDENWWIRGSYSKNEKALNELIKKEGIFENAQLQKLLKQRAVMKIAIEETDDVSWRVIKKVYRFHEMNVEQAAIRYLHSSKNYAYAHVIIPFFERVDNLLWSSVDITTA